MSIIEISGITKDYGSGKGVFDLSFNVEAGQVMGFLGPNGAGKTTTIRQLMGFIKPDYGHVKVDGLDCFKNASHIQKRVGYLPGEIAFMEDTTGIGFIKFVADMKGLYSLDRAKQLIERFELDTKGKIKRMSKGTKQKIGIVCAFMQDPEILILDEPTSGLDPLMQNRFVELVLEEKARGKTILMSSHMFEEIERTCQSAVIIRQGRVVAVEDVESLSKNKAKVFQLRFATEDAAAKFLGEYPEAVAINDRVTLRAEGDINQLIARLAQHTLLDISIKPPTLEELFMDYYGGAK